MKPITLAILLALSGVAQADNVDGLPKGASVNRSITRPILASRPGAGDVSTPRNLQPVARPTSMAARSTSCKAASRPVASAPRAVSGSDAADRSSSSRGGDSSPMLNVLGSANQADGKNGVPAGTNAAAAKRKLPSPPAVSRPMA